MNGLRGLRKALLDEDAHEIHVAPDIAARARVPIKRLLDFTSARAIEVLGNNDA